MDYLDQVLLETRIRSTLSERELNETLSILLSTKDISDTVYSIEGNANLEIVEMSFKKENGKVTFNGSLSLVSDGINLENRSIDGCIERKGKKIYVISNVYRYSEVEHKEYEVVDYFETRKDTTTRTTFYQHIKEPFKSKVEFLTEEQIEEYKQNIVNGLKQ